MSHQTNPGERTGILGITGPVNSEEKALAIKAALEDLPGVHSVEISGTSARVRFDPQIVTEQQFYEAVKIAGFQANDFQVVGWNVEVVSPFGC